MPLYVQENFTHNLAEQLRRGELDAIVVAHPFIESGIVTLAVYDEPFCLALSAGRPLAEQESVKPAQVAPENLLLLGNGNCFRDQVVQACRRLAEPGEPTGAWKVAQWRRFDTWSPAVPGFL